MTHHAPKDPRAILHRATIRREQAEDDYRRACSQALRGALSAAEGDVGRAAADLGVGQATAHRWLAADPSLREWLDTTYPDRRGRRLDGPGVRRVRGRARAAKVGG